MSKQQLRAHWFVLAAALVVAADLYVGISARGTIDRLLEAALLLDLVVLVPCLYWLCYRQWGRKAMTQAVAIACLGIWVALKLVPEPGRNLLHYVEPLRYVGIAALAWIELMVVVAIYRTVFRGGSVSQAISQGPQGMPHWAVRVLVIEANFWFRVWRAIRRLFSRQ